MTYRPHIIEKTLYRGQSKDHGVVLASGWREFWHARQVLMAEVLPLSERYLGGELEQSAFVTELSTIAATAKPKPTLHRFLQENSGQRLLIDLVDQIRDSFNVQWQSRIFRAQLSLLEKASFLRYQSYVFNDAQDDFLKQLVPSTLQRLAQLLMEFYDAHRSCFEVDLRITQVAMDFMGVLQQYGALDTPGLDFTDDLDVALWFATHYYDPKSDEYYPLPAGEFGWIYEARVPVVTWIDGGHDKAIETLPNVRAVDLSNLSPLLVRISRQRGYYAIHNSGWDRILDFGSLFQMNKRSSRHYGSSQDIKDRLSAKALTQDYLFPSRRVDPFKAYLADHQVKTFFKEAD